MSQWYLCNFDFVRILHRFCLPFENSIRELYLNVFVKCVAGMSSIELELGKIDDPLRWHKHNVTLNIFVFKEDQKSQIFLQLTVLLWNIGRNWWVSRIFNIKSYLFSFEKPSREQSSIIFWKKFLWCKKRKYAIFLLVPNLLGGYFKANNIKSYLYYCHILFTLP